MMWGDTVGLQEIVDRLKYYRDQHPGPFWEISPLLEKLATEGKTFADYDAA
jgi:3-hydroxyacyl-CoA dehydrogenase